MRERQIVALGGHKLAPRERDPLLDFLLELTGADHPRVCFVPTASGDDAGYAVNFYGAASGKADCSHLPLFPWPPDALRDFVLGHDLVYVGGGNTANMLAIWRVHGLDRILHEAWEAGVVLSGVSAGAICWFEAAVTDSFGPQLEGMRDGLGFLPGSACPHYDGEELRRPVYRRLVGEGDLPAGYAVDDGVGLHFVGTALREVVTAREGAQAYRVEPERETPIKARLLA